MLLENINSPADVKALDQIQLAALAEEIRDELLRVVSKNGGHLASNLCVVELTIALHRVFDSPNDKIIFDVGHQSYVHKLLTDRREAFRSLRTYGGLSGFTSRSESPHDQFGCGHSSTSISAAVGIAAANKLSGNKNYTVAVVGDGAFTGGMIYEALNNCSDKDRLIIVLNDNEMSISRNVGGMNSYFQRVRTSVKYFNFKNGIRRFFSSVPLIGKFLVRFATGVKNLFKRIVMSKNFFETLGLNYYGPLDGNDEKHLEAVLREAKNDGKCSVVHICTQKGKGYQFAEERPDLFHGVSGFSIATGTIKNGNSETFSERFGKIILEEAQNDERILAITAAMPSGTGLTAFKEQFPKRFFDVGIAEEHAVTFACGLATQGYRPIVALYSTFAQRAYDQILHDAALQKLPVVLMLDRAGLVCEDGATHHGVFDTAFINQIPNTVLLAPENFEELKLSFKAALTRDGVTAIRYSKGGETAYDRSVFVSKGAISYCDFGDTRRVAVLTYGEITNNALQACISLYEKGISSRIIRILRIKPLPQKELEALIKGAECVYFLEEGIKAGGIGETFISALAEHGQTDGKKCVIRAIENRFVPHGDKTNLDRLLGFMPEQICAEIEKQLYEN